MGRERNLSEVVARCLVAWVAVGVMVASPALAYGKAKHDHKHHGHGEVSLTLQVGKKAKGFTKRQRKELRKIAKYLKGHPDLGSFLIVGHTDNRGKAKFNDKLSLKRAQAVMKVLVKMGVKASRLSVVGKGGAEPKFDNKTKKGRRQNQRVELTVESKPSPNVPSIAQATESPIAKESASMPEALAAAAAATKMEQATATQVKPKAKGPSVEPKPTIKTKPVVKVKSKTKPVSNAKAKTKTITKVVPKKASVQAVVAPPVVERSSTVGTGTWVTAGITGASVAAAVYFGLDASSKRDELKNLVIGTDAHTAKADEVSQAAVSADIMYAVSALGLATTVWLWLSDEGPTESAFDVGVIVSPKFAMVSLQIPLGGSAR